MIEVKYNIKDEIEKLIKLNKSKLEKKPIELNANIAKDIPYELLGDKNHIKQIINNLVSNAIKYTENGTINLIVRCINKKDNCLLIITVQDTGRGIKNENPDVEKNSTTEGTGLGLAITKKLVELMECLN